MKHFKVRLPRAAAGFTAAALLLAAVSYFPVQPIAQAASVSTVANPIIWSDVPDDDVIRVGDTYYMISTTMFFSPGAPIMKSKDLVSWEICSYVYDTLADGDIQNLTNGKHDYSHGQWAASLRYHDGIYYVFFGSYGTGKSYIYKTSDIEHGTWTRTELNGMYHDASMLFDDDGRNYLVYGAGGEIKIKEFNAEMTGFRPGGADKTLLLHFLDCMAQRQRQNRALLSQQGSAWKLRGQNCAEFRSGNLRQRCCPGWHCGYAGWQVVRHAVSGSWLRG